jgi:cell fate regulator YaaT (PSP1 superfamily)
MEVVRIIVNNYAAPIYCETNNVEVRTGNIYIIETVFGLDAGKLIKCPIQLKKLKKEETGKLIRIANQEDFKIIEKLKVEDEKALKIAREKVSKHKLNIKIFSAHNMFDEKRIIFYFTSEKRVDFRSYVRELAAIFKKRIELRQVSYRMETRLLGGIGICGKEFCCCQFLINFKNDISLQMAKEQNLSLSDTKIIGVCGKPMCCLAYEYETYSSILKDMPKENTKVKFNAKDIKEKYLNSIPLYGELTGTVKGVNVLKRTVYVLLETGYTVEINSDKLKS